MPKKKNQFADLTWNDLEEWAGSRIVSRGRDYQRQGLVSELAITSEGTLLAWVDGSECYATRVTVDDDGHPDSICTCPYEFDCKHGVAVVLEYLKNIEKGKPIPEAGDDDERLELLAGYDWDNGEEEEASPIVGERGNEIEDFLQNRTKTQLVELIRELADNNPSIRENLADRKLSSAGNTDAIIARLRREIQIVGSEHGWQNHWNNEGHTPDYSGIRSKLEALLNAGEADKALAVAGELLETGIRQAEESHDEGDTACEVADCMTLLVRILDASSLETTDKLLWAVDAVLKDPFDLCEDFALYLHKKHSEAAWNKVADRLMKRLDALKCGADFSREYERDQLSNWIIHALESASRSEEIIPFCIAEAQKTASYERLVAKLIDAKRFDEAERWIQEGISATEKRWPGIASSLRNKFRDIQANRKNQTVVAAIEADNFVRQPSLHTFKACKKAASKEGAWPKTRQCLLAYLEKGVLPWEQKGWPLPPSGLDEASRDRHERYPMIGALIDIAIDEKKPEEVLKWYDLRPKTRFGWFGTEEDKIATAVRDHAPDRAVEIWKKMAGQLIGQVKPSAYQGAIIFLRKAAKVMTAEKKEKEWEQYMKKLKEQHIRKRRLVELLDGLDDKPIINKLH